MTVPYEAIATHYASQGFTSVGQAFAAMSVETEPMSYRLLTGGELRKWVAQHSLAWQAIKAEAIGGNAPCEMFIAEVNSDSSLDLNDTDVQTLIGAIVSMVTGVEQADADSLYTMAAQTLPKWPGLKQGHIETAISKY